MDKNLRNTKYPKTESERNKQTEQINKKLNQCSKKNLPANKSPQTDGFPGKFYQI